MGFELHRWNGASGRFEPYAGASHTDASGVVNFTGLADGRYKLVETSPQAGYSASAVYTPSDEFEINHTSNRLQVQVSATNQKIPGGTQPGEDAPGEKTPQPGDTAGAALWVALAALAAAGTLLLLARIKKARQKEG